MNAWLAGSRRLPWRWYRAGPGEQRGAGGRQPRIGKAAGGEDAVGVTQVHRAPREHLQIPRPGQIDAGRVDLQGIGHRQRWRRIVDIAARRDEGRIRWVQILAGVVEILDVPACDDIGRLGEDHGGLLDIARVGDDRYRLRIILMQRHQRQARADQAGEIHDALRLQNVGHQCRVGFGHHDPVGRAVIVDAALRQQAQVAVSRGEERDVDAVDRALREGGAAEINVARQRCNVDGRRIYRKEIVGIP